MIHHMTSLKVARLGVLLALGVASVALGACDTLTPPSSALKPDPVLPGSQYALKASTITKSVNLRVNPHGLSDNQKRALDQIASRASWTNGDPVDIQIITSGDLAAVNSGQTIGTYLIGHDVRSEDMTQKSVQEQPADIVTVNLIFYRTTRQDCNQTWENLSSTGNNKTYDNFGCAIAANIAAQIADPRDITGPAPETSTDASRKSVILDKYRKGDVTAATENDDSKGNVSDAIK